MPDIDSQDLPNCLDCAEYAADIFTFFRRLEPTVRVPPDYINQQVRGLYFVPKGFGSFFVVISVSRCIP